MALGSGWLGGLLALTPQIPHQTTKPQGFPSEQSLPLTSPRPSGSARLSWLASSSAPAGSLDFVPILLFGII